MSVGNFQYRNGSEKLYYSCQTAGDCRYVATIYDLHSRNQSTMV